MSRGEKSQRRGRECRENAEEGNEEEYDQMMGGIEERNRGADWELPFQSTTGHAAVPGVSLTTWSAGRPKLDTRKS